MSSVARAIRPFASRVLSQKPLASACQVSPAFRFPRGTRSFSQSPLCEYHEHRMLSNAVQDDVQDIWTGNEASGSLKYAPLSSMMSHFTNGATIAQLKKYTESHEWIELADGGKTAKIGITEYAAHSLGDVVFVELPEVDLEIVAGEPVGAVESVKSASDVLSPVAGKVIKGNSILEDKAKTINESPEGEGWIAEIEVADVAELDALLDEAAYKETIDA
ncbi:glycine cleavage system H-protein subunit [Penicillium rubens]|nr:glycine cleavage system H-protein subunit [Penicillium rubens]